jgi:TolB-like protein
VVAGFGLLQGADLALPRLGFPDWTVTALLVILLAGFPVVCLLTWFYDIVPDRRRDAAGSTPDDAGGRGIAAESVLRTPPPQAAMVVIAAGVAVVVLGGLAGWSMKERSAADTVALRSDWLAIAPFRVAGEAGHEYLAEGMLDLMAAKLTGEGGLRALEPRAVLAAWRQRTDGSDLDALQVARHLGAGRVLMGSVVATGSTLVLAARVLDTESGALLASFEAPGAIGEVPALVDRFTGGLLAQLAGVEPERLRTLEQTPFLALRAYLEGQRLLRTGRFMEAKAAFAEAQQVDSTFALPGVFHGIAASFTSRWSTAGAWLAWRHRESLSPRDRLLLEAFLGGEGWSPRDDRLAVMERLTAQSPDRAEAWYLHGDYVYHYDLVTPLPDRLARAAGLFGAATRLDSHFGPADIHLLEIALLQGDTAAARAHARSYLSFSTEGDLADYTRWFLDRLEGRPLPELPRTGAFHLMSMFPATMTAQLGVGLDVADAVIEWGARTATEADYFILTEAPLFMLNRGRPARAAEMVRQRGMGPEVAGPVAAIFRGLYWETGESRESLAPVAARLAAAARERRALDGSEWEAAACAAGQYHAMAGTTDIALEMAAALLVAGAATTEPARYAAACRTLITVLTAPGGQELARAVADLDRVHGEGRSPDPWLRDAASLVLAAGYERLGDLPRALDATRRRTVGVPHARFLSTQLREEGRIAALLGRRAEAERAFGHYLALRDRPEPDVLPFVEQVRRELAALQPDAR